MSSDSPLSDAQPSDAVVEEALRKSVRDVFESGALEDLTVRRIRKTVEQELELPEDFFKTDQDWKERSKNIISAAVEAHEHQNASSQQAPPSEQSAPQSAPSTKKAPGKTSNPKGTKRGSAGTEAPRKRLKKNVESNLSDEDDEEPVRQNKKAVTKETSAPSKTKPEKNTNADSESPLSEHSESEMSVLIDEEPKRKGRQKKDPAAKPAKTGPKAKKGSEQPADPDQEEIKRLQGWLVKCGIRKMWYKELAPHPTPKDKIRHLKQMLSDAGMTGRFSQEKATQIKEQRELKADLEAVQEGAKIWGKTGSGDEGGDDGAATGAGRPRRRLAKGLQGLDFLNDDDGEETD